MTVLEPLVPKLDLPIDERTRDLLERRRRSSGVNRGWLVRRALLAADLVGLTAALLIVEFVLPFRQPRVGRVDQLLEVSLFLLSLPVWVVMAKLYGLYDRDEERTDHSTADDFTDVFHMVTVGTWVVYIVLRLSGLADPSLAKVATFWVVAVGLVAASRAVARAYCRRQVAYLQNTVIVGAGDVGQTVARKFLNHPEYGINLVGFVDDQPKERRADLDDLTILGGSVGPEGDREGARRRPRRVRLLERAARGDRRPDPVAQEPRRADRHRAAACSTSSGRGSASTRSRACRCSGSPRPGSRARPGC